MAHLVFRCDEAKRVIATGIEIDPEIFKGFEITRLMPCRFCGGRHPWEIVEHAPDLAALMSLRAEDFLGRSVQSEFHASQARDRAIRELHQRMAAQWYRLAVEREATGDALR